MKNRRAFVLLEVMLGVAIFAMGVIALGRCVNNCLSAEIARAEDERARLALENRMAEIESGEVVIEDPKTEELEGRFAGLTLKQSRTQLKVKNEKNEDILGLYKIDLEVDWNNGNEPQVKQLTFYVLRSR